MEMLESEADRFLGPEHPGFHIQEWLAFNILGHLWKHPLNLARVLARAGYQPLPPKAMSLWGQPWLMFYPNMLKYIYHLYKVDGLHGLYRGYSEYLLTSFVETVAREELYARLAIPRSSKNGNRRRKIVQVILEGVARGVSVVMSQPFYVITVRKLLQFIGKETVYNNIWSAAREIYRSQGLMGFFACLAPRLLSELVPFLITAIAFAKATIYDRVDFPASAKYFCYTTTDFAEINDTSLMQYVCNPFYVMSTVMAACGCGLKAAYLPNMVRCHAFGACLLDIIRRKRFLDGATLFWCYCPTE